MEKYLDVCDFSFPGSAQEVRFLNLNLNFFSFVLFVKKWLEDFRRTLQKWVSANHSAKMCQTRLTLHNRTPSQVEKKHSSVPWCLKSMTSMFIEY